MTSTLTPSRVSELSQLFQDAEAAQATQIEAEKKAAEALERAAKANAEAEAAEHRKAMALESVVVDREVAEMIADGAEAAAHPDDELLCACYLRARGWALAFSGIGGGAWKPPTGGGALAMKQAVAIQLKTDVRPRSLVARRRLAAEQARRQGRPVSAVQVPPMALESFAAIA